MGKLLVYPREEQTKSEVEDTIYERARHLHTVVVKQIKFTQSSLSQIKYMNDLTHLLQKFQKTLDILCPRHYFYKLQQHHRNCLRFETALKNTMFQIQMNTTN